MKSPLLIACFVVLAILSCNGQDAVCGCSEINQREQARLNGTFSDCDSGIIAYIKRGESKPYTGKCITIRGTDTIEKASFVNGNMIERTQVDWHRKVLSTFNTSEKFLHDSVYCEIYKYTTNPI